MTFKQRVSNPIVDRESDRLRKQLQRLKNEMEFVEILAQFWPLPNMVERLARLEKQYLLLQAKQTPMQPRSAFNSVPRLKFA